MSSFVISYDRENKAIAKDVADEIRQLGHTVWVDLEVSGGQEWWDEILFKIRECDVLLYALSPESLNSIACKREYHYAAKLGKPIFPVLISDRVYTAFLPPLLLKIQFVDYRNRDRETADKLEVAIAKIPPPGTLPDPVPVPPDIPPSFADSRKKRADATSLNASEPDAGSRKERTETIPLDSLEPESDWEPDLLEIPEETSIVEEPIAVTKERVLETGATEEKEESLEAAPPKTETPEPADSPVAEPPETVLPRSDESSEAGTTKTEPPEPEDSPAAEPPETEPPQSDESPEAAPPKTEPPEPEDSPAAELPETEPPEKQESPVAVPSFAETLEPELAESGGSKYGLALPILGVLTIVVLAVGIFGIITLMKSSETPDPLDSTVDKESADTPPVDINSNTSENNLNANTEGNFSAASLPESLANQSIPTESLPVATAKPVPTAVQRVTPLPKPTISITPTPIEGGTPGPNTNLQIPVSKPTVVPRSTRMPTPQASPKKAGTPVPKPKITVKPSNTNSGAL